MFISTTDIQNSFGKYLKLSEYEDVIITKNSKKVARLSRYKDVYDESYLSESFIREGTPEYAHAHIRMTYEEFLKITENSDKRYEFIDGEIYVLASPMYPHQKAVAALLGKFLSWFSDKPCEPLTSPFDVTLYKSETNICVVQPDILVICDHDKIDKKGRYKGTPSLVVEVLSESGRSKDFLTKLDLYMRSGVQEYWIVNPSSKEVNVYTFNEGNIETMQTFKENENALSTVFEGLSVNLEQIFG